jgi:hypothetical protein
MHQQHRTRFQAAVEARDLDAVREALAPDVRLYSPLKYTPFEGRDVVAGILRIPAAVFGFDDAFRYTSVFSHGDEHALFFESKIDGRRIEGVDFLRVDERGLVTELRVLMRPLAEVQRFAERAAQMLDQGVAERP